MGKVLGAPEARGQGASAGYVDSGYFLKAAFPS